MPPRPRPPRPGSRRGGPDRRRRQRRRLRRGASRRRTAPAPRVLAHPANRGKGAALKTGFRTSTSEGPGDDVVTADATGSTPLATSCGWPTRCGRIRPGARPCSCSERAASAARSPSGAGSATRSRGRSSGWRPGGGASDTQTGLRGIPVGMLPWLRQVPGERFEYEIEMLLRLGRAGFAAREIRDRDRLPRAERVQPLPTSRGLAACHAPAPAVRRVLPARLPRRHGRAPDPPGADGFAARLHRRRTAGQRERQLRRQPADRLPRAPPHPGQHAGCEVRRPGCAPPGVERRVDGGAHRGGPSAAPGQGGHRGGAFRHQLPGAAALRLRPQRDRRTTRPTSPDAWLRHRNAQGARQTARLRWTSRTASRGPHEHHAPAHHRRHRRCRHPELRPVLPPSPPPRPRRRLPRSEHRRPGRHDRARLVGGRRRTRPRAVRGAVHHPAALLEVSQREVAYYFSALALGLVSGTPDGAAVDPARRS